MEDGFRTPVLPWPNNPTQTNAGTETLFYFGLNGNTTVTHFEIQNNTSALVQVELDAPATAGSLVLAANGGSWRDDGEVTVIHLLTAAAQPINSSSTGIIIRGWI
jgi:hypothetical protein